MIGHLKWHEELKLKLNSEIVHEGKSMAEILFPHLFSNTDTSKTNEKNENSDKEADITPDAIELLENAKSDGEKFKIVRFIDKYGC